MIKSRGRAWTWYKRSESFRGTTLHLKLPGDG